MLPCQPPFQYATTKTSLSYIKGVRQSFRAYSDERRSEPITAMLATAASYSSRFLLQPLTTAVRAASIHTRHLRLRTHDNMREVGLARLLLVSSHPLLHPRGILRGHCSSPHHFFYCALDCQTLAFRSFGSRCNSRFLRSLFTGVTNHVAELFTFHTNVVDVFTSRLQQSSLFRYRVLICTSLVSSTDYPVQPTRRLNRRSRTAPAHAGCCGPSRRLRPSWPRHLFRNQRAALRSVADRLGR